MGYHKVKQYFVSNGTFLTCVTEVEGNTFTETIDQSACFELNLKAINAMIGSGKDKAEQYLNSVEYLSKKCTSTLYDPYKMTYTARMMPRYEFICSRCEKNKSFRIKDVIFNGPATIVFWSDGTKTVVKAENEPFDREKGLAMAISKKFLGNKGKYFETFKKFIKEDTK